MRSCPLCSGPMARELRDGVTIDVCHAHGLWLDQKELLAITEYERHKEGPFVWGDLFRRPIHPPADPQRRLPCPVCQGTMALTVYREVTLDQCAKHGVWLDNGEMDAILNNLRLDDSYLRGMALRLTDGRL